MEKLYQVKHNGSLDGIEKIDSLRERAENNFSRIKETEKISSSNLGYLKMINSDGKA